MYEGGKEWNEWKLECKYARISNINGLQRNDIYLGGTRVGVTAPSTYHFADGNIPTKLYQIIETLSLNKIRNNILFTEQHSF